MDLLLLFWWFWFLAFMYIHINFFWFLSSKLETQGNVIMYMTCLALNNNKHYWHWISHRRVLLWSHVHNRHILSFKKEKKIFIIPTEFKENTSTNVCQYLHNALLYANKVNLLCALIPRLKWSNRHFFCIISVLFYINLSPIKL